METKKKSPAKIYNGKEVVTLREIGDAHNGRRMITSSFERNRSKFVEGVHFYKLTIQEFIDMYNIDNYGAGNRSLPIYLFNKTGYLLLIKPIRTKAAWDLFEFAGSLVEENTTEVVEEKNQAILVEHIGPRTPAVSNQFDLMRSIVDMLEENSRMVSEQGKQIETVNRKLSTSMSIIEQQEERINFLFEKLKEQEQLSTPVPDEPDELRDLVSSSKLALHNNLKTVNGNPHTFLIDSLAKYIGIMFDALRGADPETRFIEKHLGDGRIVTTVYYSKKSAKKIDDWLSTNMNSIYFTKVYKRNSSRDENRVGTLRCHGIRIGKSEHLLEITEQDIEKHSKQKTLLTNA